MGFGAVPEQNLGDNIVPLRAGQVERGASLGVCGIRVGVKVVEQGDDCGVLLVPDGGEQGIVDVPMRVVVLQRAILQVVHDLIDAGQVLETLFDVVLLPDLLVKVVLRRIVDGA